jgi:Uncharacterized conserved protein
MHLALKRVYDPPEAGDGIRILVDRLWPRGISKAKAAVDVWLKDIAPGTELREWFHHDPDLWDEFRRRYAGELRGNPEAVKALREAMRGHETVTLLYGAKDTEHNQAVVLRDMLAAKEI